MKQLYTVHVGQRTTTDIQIVAESEEEARAEAKRMFENSEISDDAFEFANDDYDVIDVQAAPGDERTFMNDPKLNANDYWDIMEEKTLDFLKEIAGFSVKPMNNPKALDATEGDCDWDFAKTILHDITDTLEKDYGCEFPEVLGNF